MATTSVTELNSPKPVSSPSIKLPRSLRRIMRNPMAIIGLIIVVGFISIGITAEIIAPYDHDQSNFMLARDGPTAEHPLGNDELGRDMLSRLMYGARISLLLGIMSVGIGLSIGVPMGILAGYFGGAVDMLVTSLIDMMLAFPSILLAIMMVAFLGPSLENAMIAIGVLSIPIYTDRKSVV